MLSPTTEGEVAKRVMEACQKGFVPPEGSDNGLIEAFHPHFEKEEEMLGPSFHKEDNLSFSLKRSTWYEEQGKTWKEQ